MVPQYLLLLSGAAPDRAPAQQSSVDRDVDSLCDSAVVASWEKWLQYSLDPRFGAVTTSEEFLGHTLAAFFSRAGTTIYLSPHYFPLLASLPPFTKFVINNMVLPLSHSLWIWFSCRVSFRRYYEAPGHWRDLLMNCLGFIVGGITPVCRVTPCIFQFTATGMIPYYQEKSGCQDLRDHHAASRPYADGRHVDLEHIKLDTSRWKVRLSVGSLTPRLVVLVWRTTTAAC